MSPRSKSPMPAAIKETTPYLVGGALNSREATPIAKGDAELASVFKSDLTNLKNLVTCTICDQLLYEPWTLGCGHTYCYSCLCQWFLPNKRKKTCPECRTAVKNIPAPAYLVKQMVEIFTKRPEIMPSDESAEQHKTRRAEETAAVDKDKTSTEGLFKGVFPPPSKELTYDEADGVYRCPGCLAEHEGGPTCTNCGVPVVDHGGYDFSDIDEDYGDDMDDMEGYDVDSIELELEEDGRHHHHHFPPAFMGVQHYLHGHGHFHHHHHHMDLSEDSDPYDSDQDDLGGDSDEEGSLQEFVVNDEDEHESPPFRGPQQPINISDDESDDESIVPVRRRRVANVVRDSSPSARSVVTVSSAGDMDAQTMLREAGWSPLHPRDDSEAEPEVGFYGFSPYDQEDESDTETMVGNGGSDDEAHVRNGLSETPRYDYEHYGSEPSEDEDEDGNIHETAMLDRDGDTEMSSNSSLRSRSGSIDSVGTGGLQEPQSHSTGVESGYGGGENQYATVTDTSSDEEEPETEMGELLGASNQIQEMEDDSSDDSIVPPVRRRRPQSLLNQYDRTHVFNSFRTNQEQQYDASHGSVAGPRRATPSQRHRANPLASPNRPASRYNGTSRRHQRRN